MNARIVLVDDQELLVKSLSEILQTKAPDLEVVAIGYNGHDAIRLAETYQPDVLVLDVRMPILSGVNAVGEILAISPSTKVIMLTTYDDDEYVNEAIQHGAIGYLLKDMPPDDLISALRSVRFGAFLMPSHIARKLIQPVTGTVYHGGVEETDLPEWYYQLSTKERRILRLLVERYSNREIADRIHLAEQTVKNYLSNIYLTINAGSRREAIEIAECYVRYL